MEFIRRRAPSWGDLAWITSFVLVNVFVYQMWRGAARGSPFQTPSLNGGEPGPFVAYEELQFMRSHFVATRGNVFGDGSSRAHTLLTSAVSHGDPARLLRNMLDFAFVFCWARRAGLGAPEILRLGFLAHAAAALCAVAPPDAWLGPTWELTRELFPGSGAPRVYGAGCAVRALLAAAAVSRPRMRVLFVAPLWCVAALFVLVDFERALDSPVDTLLMRVCRCEDLVAMLVGAAYALVRAYFRMVRDALIGGRGPARAEQRVRGPFLISVLSVLQDVAFGLVLIQSQAVRLCSISDKLREVSEASEIYAVEF
ncbi:hypothetical protein DL764_003114 [Monosporascus ibericus]|uniref:Uncharacterized protein n=1 Tax=Monosporascus ibericus TaxID=155417 RepID=A0A4Q4TLT3_9PEZI|nr:hypothetical protein DL764_003114 [Monosporascus ibericus]